MKRIFLFLILIFLSTHLKAQRATVITSPESIPVNDHRIKIFLGGSIDMGNAENWQATMEQKLADKNVILLNPRREDWNKDWKPVSTNPHFRQQVEWELNALESADLIVMYFAPTSKSPISLLELGLYARTGKLMVVCPDGYWRKGNVDIVCEKYNIKTYADLDLLTNALESLY